MAKPARSRRDAGAALSVRHAGGGDAASAAGVRRADRRPSARRELMIETVGEQAARDAAVGRSQEAGDGAGPGLDERHVLDANIKIRTESILKDGESSASATCSSGTCSPRRCTRSSGDAVFEFAARRLISRRAASVGYVPAGTMTSRSCAFSRRVGAPAPGVWFLFAGTFRQPAGLVRDPDVHRLPDGAARALAAGCR